MPTENLPTEADLEELLRDDPRVFLEILDESYRERIIRRLKSLTHGLLDPSALLDLYQVTLLDVWQKVQKPDFAPERPLRMVNAIARNKAIDALRSRRSEIRKRDAHIDAVRHALNDTQTGDAWSHFDAAERERFRNAVIEITATLPVRERIVAQAYADHIEELTERQIFDVLAAAVSKITGEDEDAAAMKSAWHRARKKLKAGLIERGFNIVQGDSE